MAKDEFPCLLKPGFQAVTEEFLREKCVAAFPLSTTRKSLMDALAKAIARIAAAGIPAELWIDGSFLTEKIDPTDIDLVLIVPAHVTLSPTLAIRATLDWIGSDATLESEGLDAYVLTKHQAGAMEVVWHVERARFEKLFGTEYDDVTPKGVGVMRFHGGA